MSRRRAVVLGKVRVREVATRFWLMTFAGLAIFAVAYVRYADVELDARKSKLMQRQRAVRQAAGEGLLALRERLETWVVSLATGQVQERFEGELELASYASSPGFYVRALRSEAMEAATLRAAARRSLHDGFTSCLFVGRKGDPAAGPSCKSTGQCDAGEICNGWSVCAPPAPPYGLWLLNEGLRILEPRWANNLEASSNEFEVRAMELDLEAQAKHEVPAAVEAARRSRYFTAVLDEVPEQGLSAAREGEGQGVDSPAKRVQALPHYVRVGIWDLERSRAIAAMRVRAEGRFVSVGRRVVGSPRIVRAQTRQANNCAAATEVRERLARGRAAESAPPADARVAAP